MKKVLIFKKAQLLTEDGIISEPFIEIEKGKITGVGIAKDRQITGTEEIIQYNELVTIVPGFIDIHIHGIENADVMDGEMEAISTMQRALVKEGTTSFLATTITQSVENKKRALRNVKNTIQRNGTGHGAEVLGIHLEGPFISTKRAGAQPLQYISPADISLFNAFQEVSGNLIKLVTLAPEETAFLLVEHLKNQGVIPSIGHSDASYEEVVTAIKMGLCHATHLFNGMKGVHHRDIGVAGAALLHDELKAEMIVDGIHISPPMVKLAYKNKGADGIILITDSMRAKGLTNGIYSLGGQDVYVKNGRAELADGTLAGSMLKMNDAVRNMISFSGCTFQEAIRMATINPAKQLGIADRKGSIAIGKDADFTVLNEQFEIQQTFTFGNQVYEKVKA